MAAEGDPDLDRLADSFNEMADAVQARIEREARFASDVSHELRSPITALAAAAEVMHTRRGELPERTQQALDVVVGQVRRFDAMVMDLLELSRIDAGATDLNTEEVDIEELCRRVAGRNGFPHLPVEVGWRAPSTAVVDKLRFERIIANLLENAVHHGGGPVRISIERGDGRHILVAVEDAGPGVARGERVRIFERFARGSAARHRVGTGLGLALVAEHAAAQGGDAWAEDRPGGGARFVVQVPSGASAVRRLIALAIAGERPCAVAAACGVGGDGELQQIGSDDLAGLDQTTTSTTTTTTTVAPTATVPEGTTTTIGATTSTIATEPVELYFVTGSVLESVSQELTRGVSLSRVLTALESGPPPPDVGIGLTSDLPIGLTRSVTESGTGVATVDLVGDLFEDIPGGVEQRRAIAQIVLTLTMRPGIGQVRFTLDGEPLAVPKLGNVLSDPGEPVARIDYESLLDQDDVFTTDQPTTSTPTTSPPPPSTEGRTVPSTTA